LDGGVDPTGRANSRLLLRLQWSLRVGSRLQAYPQLELLLERDTDAEPVWFAVPGMTGGFSYRLVSDGVEAILISESWCRVVDGSGQRHEITSAGSRLVAEGFV